METKDYSDFYESAKRIVAAISEKEALEKIGFIQKPDNPEILGEHVHVGYIDKFISGDLLEKAWKMPWKESLKGDLKPVLTIYGDNLDILDGNNRIWKYNDAGDALTEFFRGAFCGDWRDFE